MDFMQTTELDPQNISAASEVIPENTPVVMLNLVRYKQQADYADQTEFGPCSGREAYYQRYAPAFAKIAERSESAKNFRVMFVGAAIAKLIGPEDEQWDDVVLVEYPNFAAFRAVVESPEYQRDAYPHRRAALANWRLIAMVKQPQG